MSEIQLSKLVQVPRREVWKHEALDFTHWLALPENIEYLSEAIGIELVDIQTEVGVGQFQVDILATDENDRRVIIENQLEPTDHDHLGKIITYAAGLQADVVVWIVERAREEHEQPSTGLTRTRPRTRISSYCRSRPGKSTIRSLRLASTSSPSRTIGPKSSSRALLAAPLVNSSSSKEPSSNAFGNTESSTRNSLSAGRRRHRSIGAT